MENIKQQRLVHFVFRYHKGVMPYFDSKLLEPSQLDKLTALRGDELKQYAISLCGPIRIADLVKCVDITITSGFSEAAHIYH